MRIGIDFGGTKIEGVALDDNGDVLARVRLATPRGDYEASLDAVAGLVTDLEGRAGTAESIGMGIPGALSRKTGLVKNANSIWLIDRDLKRNIEQRLARPVAIANDANCFAVSEATDGAGAGAKMVFGVILGTGVGAGIAIDGRAWEGANAIAGEWGHNPLPWPSAQEVDGPVCYCGRSGCNETYLSGPGFARDHTTATARTMTSAEIIDAMRAADNDATASYTRYLDRLARGLAHVINVIDPDIIVLGGGMSNIVELYDDLPNRLRAYVFSDTCETEVVPARFGDSSGVRGAAWLGRV